MFTKLDYVYAVYSEGSFTRAAERLFISQPSLSAAIKSVEKEVGAPLFERGGKGAIPTEVGLEYIAAAEKMMQIRKEFLERVNDIFSLNAGELTVGGTNYLCSYVLPRVINRFSAEHPRITVTLVEDNSVALHQMVTRGEIDVVIDSFDEPGAELVGYPLLNERIMLAVPRSLPLNERLKEYAIRSEDVTAMGDRAFDRPALSVSEFASESFVLLKSGNDMRMKSDEIFAKAKLTPKVAFEIDQLNTSYSLTESGMGLSFVTDTLFRSQRRSGDVLLYNVSEATSGRTLYVAHKKNKYATRAMTELIRTAKEVVDTLF